MPKAAAVTLFALPLQKAGFGGVTYWRIKSLRGACRLFWRCLPMVL